MALAAAAAKRANVSFLAGPKSYFYVYCLEITNTNVAV